MKLQKQVAYKYKDTIHYKYVIIVPDRLIKELNWKENQELDAKVEDSQLIFERKKQR